MIHLYKMNQKYVLPLIASAIFLVLIVAGGVYLHSINIPVLEPAGPIGLAERGVIVLTLLLCAIIVLPVFFMLFFFAWRYRAGSHTSRRSHHPGWDHYDWVAEAVWWLVPSVIIFFLSILAWQSSHALDPYNAIQGSGPAITIDVVALDWKWLFIYPDQGIASVNLVEFPTDTPVHFNLTADAPMNSFWIPQLGSQIMVMPGMNTQLNLMADRDGDFNGFSAQISGEGFSGMTFDAKSVPHADFDQWVALVKRTDNPLSPATYAALAQPSENNPPETFSSVDSSLYTAVVNKYMP